MKYMVITDTGKEHGPANTDTLKRWVGEGRIQPQTLLKEMSGGPLFPASQLADLFQNTAVQAGQYASPPSFQSYNASSSNDDYGDKGVLIGVIIRSLLAIVFFFVFKGIGLIFAGYALYYAIQQKIDGDKYGTAAILIASAAAGAVGVGWLLRLAGY